MGGNPILSDQVQRDNMQSVATRLDQEGTDPESTSSGWGRAFCHSMFSSTAAFRNVSWTNGWLVTGSAKMFACGSMGRGNGRSRVKNSRSASARDDLLRQCARDYPLLTLAGLNESVSDYTHKAKRPMCLPYASKR